jgi:pimeloyl-ACP methyl ester carboxylesterase
LPSKEILLPTTRPLLPESLGLRTTWFDLPGLKLHTAVGGPEGGPLVILLHGFPDFWYSWRRIIPALTQAGLRVVVPDQRGYNLSGKKGPYDIFTLSDDIAHLIEACGRQEAYIAGHDWGAAVAWALGILYPEMVRKLAILNVPHPALMMSALQGGSLRQLLKSWYIFFFQIPGLPEALLSGRDFAGLRRLLRGSAKSGTFTAQELAWYEIAWAQPGALPAMIGWYRAIFRLGFSPRRAELAQKVGVPTLIQWGDRDVALEAALAVRSLEWCGQGRLVRYPQATHWVHLDQPQEVGRELVEFFK